jgi:putative peptide zinc metalloprotease protein
MTDNPTAVGDLGRRKKVRPRLRPNLVLTPQEQAGQACTVVKDPVCLAYYRLDERQRFIAGLLDGSHTLEQIQAAYERRYAPERLSLEELENFTAQLLHSGLAQSEAPLAGRLLFDRSQKQRRARRRAALLNFLSIRIPLLDPDHLLGRLLPRVRLALTPRFLLLGCGLVLSALTLLATHWQDFVARLPSAREFFSPRTVLILWLALGLVKVLHELGHGLCCKACGGEVHETGVLLLVLFPALYCDVSDGWMLPRKWQRIAISLAGIYVELLVAALATLLWWASAAGTIVHNVCLGLMVVCSVNTVLFNANPLMRFDGYFALSDWLEVPNLAAQANRVVQAGVMRWLGIDVPTEDGPASWRKGFLAVYAVGSYLYRWAVLAGVFWVLYAFLEPRKLGALWYALTLASLAVMLVWPVCRLARVLYRQGRLPEMKPARLWWSAGLLGAVAVVVCFVPFPVTVRGAALLQVEPDQVQRVTVPEPGGYLKELLVQDGQRVRAGDVLAVLANPELAMCASTRPTKPCADSSKAPCSPN